MRKEFKLTQDGVKELENELASLNDLKPQIVDQLKQARSQGDLSENADYDAARGELERTESRIKEVMHILQNVEIIKTPKTNGAVKLGSTVDLKSPKGKTTFKVVGSVEANPGEGKISDKSPIGVALLGKKVGENVEISLPSGMTVYKVQAIS
jgi:transcription elongation factor GreA